MELAKTVIIEKYIALNLCNWKWREAEKPMKWTFMTEIGVGDVHLNPKKEEGENVKEKGRY